MSDGAAASIASRNFSLLEYSGGGAPSFTTLMLTVPNVRAVGAHLAVLGETVEHRRSQKHFRYTVFWTVAIHFRYENRTRSKAEPLARRGANLVNEPSDLADVDVLFTMVATGDDVKEVCLGPNGVFGKGGVTKSTTLVECSSIGIEESNELRRELANRGVQYVVASVSGNGNCVRAGKLSSVASGPGKAFQSVKPLIETFAPRGVYYVGDGDLARSARLPTTSCSASLSKTLSKSPCLRRKRAFRGPLSSSS